MPLLLDNTGIHSFGRTVEKRAKGIIDVLGFLNFVSLIPFTEYFLINAFEATDIKKRTNELCERINSYQNNCQLIVLSEISRDDYLEACRQAAHLCSNEAAVTFDTTCDASASLQPEMAPSLIRLELDLISAIKKKITMKEVREKEQEGSVHFANLASYYMLCCCPELRKVILDIVNEAKEWTNLDTARLDSYFRLFLNDILARQIGAVYAPSVSRAKTINRQRQIVQDMFLKKINNLEKRFSESQQATLPAVSRFLLAKGRGEPDGIIEAAFELRSQVNELRHWIEELSKVVDTSDPAGFYKAREQIDAFGQDLCAQLRPKWGSLEIGTGLFRWSISGNVVIPISAIKQGIRHIIYYQRVAAISEMIKYSHFEGKADAFFQRLVRLTAS